MLNTAQGWGIERKWRGYERYMCQFQFNIVCPRYLLGDEGINKQTPGTVMSDTAYASDILSAKGVHMKQMKKQVRANVWLPNLATDKTWWRY